MSDVLEQDQETTDTQVTVDDLQKMLEDVRREKETVERERDTERSTRFQTQQELEAERAARLVTEQERDGATARVVTEAEQRYNMQKESVKTGIETQRERVATAEEAYARHAETGEWKAAAAAQRLMSEASAKLANLEAQQEYLETNKEKLVPPPPTKAEVQQREQARMQRVAPSDRISQIVGDLVGGERAWLEKRPKFVDDPSYQRQVFGASTLATGRGYSRGSDPYFKEMERILGEGEETPARQEPRQTQTRQPSADIAPQRRAVPGGDVQGTREVRLTPDEAEVADGMYGQPNSPDYIPERDKRYLKYHENKERLRLAGRI